MPPRATSGRRLLFFFSSRRRHTRLVSDWSSDVCSSGLILAPALGLAAIAALAVLAFASPRTLTGMLAFAVAGWLIGASVLDFAKRKGARASAFAAALAHAGLGVTLMGVAGTPLLGSEGLGVG